LAPPTRLTLEASLEFLRDDECVEVTPDNVRLRKLILEKVTRLKASKRRDSAPR
jgi:GTP-binding protein